MSKHLVAMGTLASASCALLVLSTALARAEHRTPQAFDISPQSLGSALSEFARQSRTEILFAPAIVSNKDTDGVRGTLQPLDALAQLLHGAGLTFTTTPQGAILVRNERSSGASSGPVRIAHYSAAQSATPLTDGQGTAPPAADTGAAAAALEEVIVTAQRREESAQSVPISMSVFSHELISQYISDPYELANLTPNYQVVEQQGLFGSASTMRGLGSSDRSDSMASTNILTYYDGIAGGTAFVSTIPQWDLDRIEVLRGPQGTLFGRNAVGGAIQYISAAPTDELEGYGKLTVGEFDLIRFESAISGPITQNVKARLSTLTHDRGGDVINTYLNTKQGEKEWWGVKGIVDWQIAAGFEARAKAQHFEGGIEQVSYNAAPGRLLSPNVRGWLNATGVDPDESRNSNYERIQSGLDPSEALTVDMAELDLSYDFGAVALTAVGGYIAGEVDNSNGSPVPAPHTDQLQFADTQQWSGEVRLASQTDRPWQWIVGAYYQYVENSLQYDGDVTANYRDLDGDRRTRHNADSPEDLLDGIIPLYRASTILLEGGNEQELETYALFLHTTYEWTERLTTTHAVRYTHEDKTMDYRFVSFLEFPVSFGVTPGTVAQHHDFVRFAGLTPEQQRQQALSIIADANTVDSNGNIVPYTASDSWDEPTWRFAADFALTDEAMIYASVAKGFRGGIFSLLAGNARTAASAEPERSVVFEVGAKTQWLNNRLQINASAFHNDHRDFQTNLIDLAAGSVTVVDNLPKVVIVGGELEIKAVPTEHLLLAINFGYLETEITEVTSGNEALLGNEAPFAEDANFSGIVRYDVPTRLGVLSPQISGRYWGEYWSTKENNDITGKLGDFWTIDLRLGYESPDGKMYGLLYWKNLFDEVQAVRSSSDPVAALGSTFSRINERRNWGVTVGYRF